MTLLPMSPSASTSGSDATIDLTALPLPGSMHSSSSASNLASVLAPWRHLANGRARLWFRQTARWLGLNPSNIAHMAKAYIQPLPAEDVEELKKMFVPLSSLLSLVMLFVGPLVVPGFYAPMCCAFFSLIVFVNYSHLVRYLIVFQKLRSKALDWAANPNPKVPFKHLHAIVIPNYQEPITLLRATLTQLAQHRSARSHYMIVLAMEAAEGSEGESKAVQLSSDFKGAFHSILTTVHPVNLPGECRGKGANVAWAVKKLDAHVQQLPTVQAHQVILTVVDADAGLSELYFNELEREMVENPSHGAVPLVDPQFRVFCPPIFFARNPHQVPALVRATDVAWSVAFMQNLGSPRNLHFPCSSYSVTLPLAQHVGGWDTSADAIGEDMHMFLKCFYHTHGLAKATPIFVPVNLANVQASTYLGSMGAKFTQVRRHLAGSADSLYAMRHALWPASMSLPPPVPTRAYPAGYNVIPHTNGTSTKSDDVESASTPLGTINYAAYTFDRILCFFQVLEAHMVPATSWLTMLAIPMTALLNPTLSQSWTFSTYLAVLSVIMLVPYAAMALMYEYTHRLLTESNLLGNRDAARRTRSWWYLFDYALLPVCAILYVAMPATSHCNNAVRILVLRKHAKEFQYVVAEKGQAAEETPEVPAAHTIPAPSSIALLPPHLLASAPGTAATSPALSEVDSGIDRNEKMSVDDEDEDVELAGVSVAPTSAPATPLMPLPATPSSILTGTHLHRLATTSSAVAAMAMPRLQLPPSVSPSIALTPPSPHPTTSHMLQSVAAESWAAARSASAKKGHAKHLSTDSGFYEPSVASVGDAERQAAISRWVASNAHQLQHQQVQDL
ncbi:hypothetical protein BCR44DRAFT_49111 [Catenaria anguillulae PL171]|uniref:Glycosyltransferase 2-like domain-containing protein n=1 Tax=Catenaria anguillulae PL171 TaxID=765915 RepID=A0A1Y2HU33_9FUNG|nr:hypothetical protein BCR44DRAFT_49111 [Catenaria anguillulae PL171]